MSKWKQIAEELKRIDDEEKRNEQRKSSNSRDSKKVEFSDRAGNKMETRRRRPPSPNENYSRTNESDSDSDSGTDSESDNVFAARNKSKTNFVRVRPMSEFAPFYNPMPEQPLLKLRLIQSQHRYPFYQTVIFRTPPNYYHN
jgi:hypothetical protein